MGVLAADDRDPRSGNGRQPVDGGRRNLGVAQPSSALSRAPVRAQLWQLVDRGDPEGLLRDEPHDVQRDTHVPAAGSRTDHAHVHSVLPGGPGDPSSACLRWTALLDGGRARCTTRPEGRELATGALLPAGCLRSEWAGRRRRPARSSHRSGEGRNRTADTAVFSRVLYQLSYLPQQVSEPSPTRSPSAPDGLRSRDLLLDREVRTTGLLYGRICGWCRAPNGIRTRASALKGRCPRPLDDGGLPLAIFPPGTAQRV